MAMLNDQRVNCLIINKFNNGDIKSAKKTGIVVIKHGFFTYSTNERDLTSQTSWGFEQKLCGTEFPVMMYEPTEVWNWVSHKTILTGAKYVGNGWVARGCWDYDW